MRKILVYVWLYTHINDKFALYFVLAVEFCKRGIENFKLENFPILSNHPSITAVQSKLLSVLSKWSWLPLIKGEWLL